ncbi:uncharacterized protein LOC116265140 [Nymphaea colorata]|uniref:Senescence domain-containing protein n=1 Tax=Nymphaea colorata TaxID=210225 RepID=A0A5K0W827_9MAGN|nr:uncharacterized protein LOC116265140 [Nymphaea colorata]
MAIDVTAGPEQGMAEEYFEEDVMFLMWAAVETAPSGSPDVVESTPAAKMNETARKKSSPVRIPAGKSGSPAVLEFLSRSEGRGGGVDDDGEGELLPPHVIVERRFGGGGRRTAFSVCTGNGRTLKGRDLRTVRNSVLMQTGFLEGRLTS